MGDRASRSCQIKGLTSRTDSDSSNPQIITRIEDMKDVLVYDEDELERLRVLMKRIQDETAEKVLGGKIIENVRKDLGQLLAETPALT